MELSATDYDIFSLLPSQLIRVNSQWDAEYKELLEGSQQYRYDAQKAQSSQAVIDKLKHQRDDHELKREVALLRDELNKSHKKMHSLQKIDYKPRARDLEDEVALLRQQVSTRHAHTHTHTSTRRHVAFISEGIPLFLRCVGCLLAVCVCMHVSLDMECLQLGTQYSQNLPSTDISHCIASLQLLLVYFRLFG